MTFNLSVEIWLFGGETQREVGFLFVCFMEWFEISAEKKYEAARTFKAGVC